MWTFPKEDIIIQPKVHNATLIWLSGLKRNPELDQRIFSILPIVEELRIRIVMAPSWPADYKSNKIIQSWCCTRIRNTNASHTSFYETSLYIDEVLHEEYEMCQNLFLGGFSQGANAALYASLVVSKVPLLGIIGLSTRGVLINVKNERKSIPIFLYQGDNDEMFDMQMTKQVLEKMLKGWSYCYLTEKGLGHNYSWKEFQLLKDWMRNLIPRGRL